MLFAHPAAGVLADNKASRVDQVSQAITGKTGGVCKPVSCQQ